MDGSGHPIPWYTYPAIEFLSRKDFSSKRILEFGGGQSTRWWALRAREVMTIEEDRGWCDSLRPHLPANVSLHHIPLDRHSRDVSQIRDLLSSVEAFDVIVVDGHLRPECGRIAFEHLAQNGAVIFDNAEWPSIQRLIRGKKQVPFHGYSPGVHRMQDTTLVFERDCFLFN
jgi:predicted O-methyltransferase YrrM